MGLHTATRVRVGILAVAAAVAFLGLHAFGVGWSASAAVVLVAVILGLALAAELLARDRRFGVLGHPADSDGVLDREWQVALAIMSAVHKRAWLGRRELRKHTARTDVDWPEVLGYTLVLLQEELRREDGGLPSRRDLLATSSRAYPAWKRLFPGEPETTLSARLLDACGYDGAPLPGPFHLILYNAVAAGVLIGGGRATLESKRPELAAQLKVNYAALTRMRREGKINPEDTN